MRILTDGGGEVRQIWAGLEEHGSTEEEAEQEEEEEEDVDGGGGRVEGVKLLLQARLQKRVFLLGRNGSPNSGLLHFAQQKQESVACQCWFS